MEHGLVVLEPERRLGMERGLVGRVPLQVVQGRGGVPLVGEEGLPLRQVEAKELLVVLAGHPEAVAGHFAPRQLLPKQ